MKNDLTQIAVVLDRSGSMSSVREATIEAFNEFVNGQKAVPGDANIMLVQFDSEGPHDVVFDKPIAEVPKLTLDTFVPRAMTPLHDAMGWTITEVGKKLSAIPESDRPGKVVFVVLTDGQENHSKEFNQKSVAEMVRLQQEKYRWTFIFIGANQDAVLTARGFGISQDTALSYNSNKQSIRSVSASLGHATTSARAGIRPSFTGAQRKRAKQ